MSSYKDRQDADKKIKAVRKQNHITVNLCPLWENSSAQRYEILLQNSKKKGGIKD